MNQENKPIKILVTGDGGIGKTTLCIVFADNDQDVSKNEYIPTICNDYLKYIVVDDKKYTVFWIKLSMSI